MPGWERIEYRSAAWPPVMPSGASSLRRFRLRRRSAGRSPLATSTGFKVVNIVNDFTCTPRRRASPDRATVVPSWISHWSSRRSRRAGAGLPGAPGLGVGRRGAGSYDAMTNVPAAVRREFADAVPFSTLTLEEEARSSDGTVKALFRTARRPSRRGGAHALPRRPPLTLPLLAVRLPADLPLLRHWRHALRPEPDAVGDPRPGVALPPARGREPRGLHGHGRADAEPRQHARRRAPTARGRDHPPADDGLDGRLAPGPAPLRGRGRRADPLRPLAARCGRGVALGADAGQRPLSARRRARRVPPLRRPARPEGLRRVRHARRRQRPGRAGPVTSPAPRLEVLQGEPHPVQPDGRLRRLLTRGARGLRRRPAPRRGADHRAPDPRPRHRGRLRPARRDRLDARRSLID